MSTHNLCFDIKKYQNFLSENFQFLEVKFSIYFSRRVFLMLPQRSDHIKLRFDVSKNCSTTGKPCRFCSDPLFAQACLHE